MSEGKERAEARLANLSAIEPLLGSLRVLSLSTMQMAINRQTTLSEYADQFALLAVQVREAVGAKSLKPQAEERFDFRPVHQKRVLAIIGSSRGICGQYNKQLAKLAAEHLEESRASATQVLAFGVRAHRSLSQEGVSFEARETLGRGSQPAYDLAGQLLREWTSDWQAGTLAEVAIISFRKNQVGAQYSAQLTAFLPAGSVTGSEGGLRELPWPPPIIEGDPAAMLEQIESHLLAIRFYQIILEAIAAENLYRYRLLEEAKENTASLLEELTLAIQTERRKEITQQLQELLVGSGMLAQR